MSKRNVAMLLGSAFGCGVLLTASTGHTYAAWSDYAIVHAQAKAGTWGSANPPATCATTGFASTDTYELPDKALPDPTVLNMPGNDHDVLVTGKSDGYDVTLGGGNDVVTVKDGNDTISLGDGNSCVITGNGPEQITLGNGDNIVRVGDGPNNIIVGNGNNTINGGNGSATVSLGGGNNTVTFGNGPDDVLIRVDGGHNTITVGTGDVSITGSGQNTCNVPANKVNKDTLSGCDTVNPT